MEVNETTNSTTEDDASGSLPLPLVITVLIIMSILSIVGTVGNIFVIIAVYVHKKLRNVHNIFIINLAVADLTVTIIVIPFAIVGATEYGEYLEQRDDLCDFIGSLVVISCVTSIQSIAHIALERYVFICLNGKYAKFYNRVTIPLMVAGIWFYAFLVDFPNLEIVGWGQHGYNHEVKACSFLYTEVVQSGYIWFLFIMGWGIPFAIICFCYTRLYLFVRRKSFSRSQRTKDSNSQPQISPKSTRKGMESADERLLRILAIVVFFFCFMWTPLPVSGFLNRFVVDLPTWAFFLCSHLGIANSCINCILYAYNKDFKDGYGVVLKKINSQVSKYSLK